MTLPRSVRAAVVQPAGHPFDSAASIEAVARFAAGARDQGAALALFPEAFVGGYPWGLAFGTAVGGRSPAGRRTWERYWASAIEVPGPEVNALGAVALDHRLYLAVGVIERDSSYSHGTLFCTLLYF